MNFATFQSFLTPFWSSWTAKDLSDAADKIATAYHISNIGQTTTPFGAPLINGDRETLKTFLDLGLKINFYGGEIKARVSSISAYALAAIDAYNRGATKEISTYQTGAFNQVNSFIKSLPGPLAFIGPIITGLVTQIFDGIISTTGSVSSSITSLIKKLKGIIDLIDVGTIAYTCMAVGFCLYWITAQFSPMPPMPPCIAPSPGVQILFPGTPIPLNSDLKDTFSGAQSTSDAVRKLYNSSILHQFTIAGLYNGLIPSPLGPVGPIPIPWFSIINIPLPPIPSPSKLIDSLKDNVIDKAKFSDREKLVPAIENRVVPPQRTKS
jgi:hypothetical protein